MTVRLRYRIIGLAVLAATLSVAITLGIISHHRARVADRIVAEINVLARDALRQQVQGVLDLVSTSNTLIGQSVMHGLDITADVVERRGGLRLGTEPVTWEVIPQTSRDSADARTIEIPEMLLGERALGQNHSFETTTPVVDEAARLVGGTVTLFQRMNADGEMLRIATNVRKADGSRAIGTYIPLKLPDGAPNPVLATVLKGEVYRGRAFVVNAWYVTAYAPLFDNKRNVIGMVFAGVPQSSVEPRDIIGTKGLGETGYVVAMIASGDQAGQLAVPRPGVAEGNLLQMAAETPLGAALTKAPKMKPGDVKLVDYQWTRPGSTRPEHVISALSYFPAWDWVIIATVAESEFSAPKAKADEALGDLARSTTTAGIGVILLVGAFAWVIGSRIARPITASTRIAEQIAAGDLASAEEALAGVAAAEDIASAGDENETRQLERAVLLMTRSLHALLGQVKLASVQLMATSNQITATVRQQEATVTEFRASTNDVVTATREISVTAQALEQTVEEVSTVTAENALVAGEGKADLEKMRGSMGLLATTSSNVATRLRAIDEKAGDIHQIVGTITRVADQTNLLSLNAAIEAEKAGEYGTGFSVVAREIRRLADQTAVATLDIESMVAEMQTAVSAGVGEMTRFEQLMARSVEDTARLADRLDGIIQRVEALAPRLQMVREGMHQQAQGAAQISESMLQLNEAARLTAESANEMNNAAGNLNGAVREMQSEVARFKLR